MAELVPSGGGRRDLSVKVGSFLLVFAAPRANENMSATLCVSVSLSECICNCVTLSVFTYVCKNSRVCVCVFVLCHVSMSSTVLL